jgi:integrase/recombinase XerC
MNHPERPAVPASDIAAARLLLQKMGIDPADLLQEPAESPQVPTFADYIPRVSQAVSDGTRRVYRTYWNRVVEAWGPRPITSVSPLEISQLAEDIKANVVARRNARGGRCAAEHLIGALRCMYSHAVADRLLSEAENPAARVPKPRRLPTARTALPDGRLAEISAIAASTGNDPALDALIIRLHAETACRRGGALALAPEDLDPEQCLIRLHEKGGTERWQPVSPTLMTHLLAHAEGRGGLESRERVLRYATGKPITSRRYDYLWDRLGEHLPWVKTQQVSTHWIRHTILTWVERRFGFAVAQAYAGHQNASQGTRAMGATGTYVRADLPEVATALSVLTGEPHPLVPEGPRNEINHPLADPSLSKSQTVRPKPNPPFRAARRAPRHGKRPRAGQALSERAPIGSVSTTSRTGGLYAAHRTTGSGSRNRRVASSSHA